MVEWTEGEIIWPADETKECWSFQIFRILTVLLLTKGTVCLEAPHFFHFIIIHSVCKKFGESCQKTNKTTDKIIFFIALQNSHHPLQHTFDNVRTANGNNQQRPPVESIAERLSHDL